MNKSQNIQITINPAAREARQHTGNFLSGLQLLFIALKLTGYIDWSWPWVLSPTIGCLVAAVLAVAVFYWATKDAE